MNPQTFKLVLTFITRKNPAIMSQPGKIFDYVVQALDADTLSGQTAERVVTSMKALLTTSGINPAQILADIPVERHVVAQKWFSS